MSPETVLNAYLRAEMRAAEIERSANENDENLLGQGHDYTEFCERLRQGGRFRRWLLKRMADKCLSCGLYISHGGLAAENVSSHTPYEYTSTWEGNHDA